MPYLIRYLTRSISPMMAGRNTCDADFLGCVAGLVSGTLSGGKWGVQQRKMCKFGSTWRYQAFLSTAAGTLSFG